jgi:hypothetical protein
MARRKGGQQLMAMALKGREKKEARESDPKPRVAGQTRFRLGPVGPPPPYEAFTWNVAPEKPGPLRKLLDKLIGSRDYSQPVEPKQEEYEKELGEAKKLLNQIEDALAKQSKEPEPLPSELPGHEKKLGKLAKEIKENLIEEEAKRKRIRKLIDLENLPEIRAVLEESRREEKKERTATAIEEAPAVEDVAALEEGAQKFLEVEAETLKAFPYPEDDKQMLAIYEKIARAFEKEIGLPENFVENRTVHTLVHSRADKAFNKFFDNLSIGFDGGEVEEFEGEVE